jgi:hypothetical protein
MRPRRRPDVLITGLFLVGVAGLMARVFLVGISVGSNDMLTWRSFARRTAEHGLGWMYDSVSLFNHPPLMGLFASLAHRLSEQSEALRFDWLFKAPMVLADLLSATLLWWTWRRRSARAGAAVFALFCWNPASILMSAYHGNTDALCASLMLVAAVLMDSGLPLWAGLALAAGINVKLVPVLLIVPLLACVRSRRGAVLYGAGLLVGVPPFLPFLFWHWEGFYEHVLAYRSYPKIWGITFVADQLRHVPSLTSLAELVFDFWTSRGSLFVLLGPCLLGALKFYWRQTWSARELLATTMIGFVVITPGWGVQYAVFPVPLLFAAYRAGAVGYSLIAGIYAACIYGALWTGTLPLFSEFVRGNDRMGRLVGGVAWLVAASVCYQLLRRRSAPPPELSESGTPEPLFRTPVDSSGQSAARAPA